MLSYFDEVVALTMSLAFMCCLAPLQAGRGQAGMVYDLYGVVNHMGGMTGGHYTACCRSSPCSKDGVEEVTGWGLEHPWLHFDDEFVEVRMMVLCTCLSY